jgi:hypothetical protein
MIPAGLCANLSDFQFKKLYESTIVHSKPLENQLGVFSMLNSLRLKFGKFLKVFEDAWL